MIMFIGLIFKLLGLGILALGVIFFISVVTGTHFMDYFSKSRWKSVLIYLLKWLLNKLGDKPGTLSESEIKQYMFRILACKKCVDNTKCVGCGCATMARMNVRDDYCSLNRWGPFETQEDWEAYEKEYNVTFSVTINGINIDDIKTEGYNDGV